MKGKIGLLQIVAGVGLIGALLCASPPKAAAQLTPNTYANILTNSGTWEIGASSTSNINAGVAFVRKDRGLALLPSFAGNNAGSAALTFTFDVSADGTNYSTTPGITVAFAMNGTTGVRGYTNFPPTQLNNVRTIRLRSIQNAHTASLFITNLTYSYHN
jgi:hypothetical protein